MSKNIVIFTSICPYPPTFGFLRRVISIIQGFKDLDYQVYLLSNEFITSTWSPESIFFLEHNFVKRLRIYKTTVNDYRIRKLFKIVYKKLGYKSPPIFSKFYTPIDMRTWFNNEIEAIKPELILINYARYDGLLNHKRFKNTQRIIDTIDLESLNLDMQAYLQKRLPPEPIRPEQVSDSVLQEDFYKNASIKVNHHEFHIYDHYTNTIAIAKSEAEIIKAHTKKTCVNFVPMTYDSTDLHNLYNGPALFPTGPTLFNIQGYLYFAKNVLPRVLKFCPDFILQITGSLSKSKFSFVPGVEHLGFVPDLAPYYQKCRFVISPVFGGTGQQIKIIEAMAHGLPVIALEDAAERSPLEHLHNGLVAHNASEFAEHVCRLWLDKNLCRKLGQSARETIQDKFSQDRLTTELSSIIRL